MYVPCVRCAYSSMMERAITFHVCAVPIGTSVSQPWIALACEVSSPPACAPRSSPPACCGQRKKRPCSAASPSLAVAPSARARSLRSLPETMKTVFFLSLARLASVVSSARLGGGRSMRPVATLKCLMWSILSSSEYVVPP